MIENEHFNLSEVGFVSETPPVKPRPKSIMSVAVHNPWGRHDSRSESFEHDNAFNVLNVEEFPLINKSTEEQDDAELDNSVKVKMSPMIRMSQRERKRKERQVERRRVIKSNADIMKAIAEENDIRTQLSQYQCFTLF